MLANLAPNLEDLRPPTRGLVAALPVAAVPEWAAQMQGSIGRSIMRFHSKRNRNGQDEAGRHDRELRPRRDHR